MVWRNFFSLAAGDVLDCAAHRSVGIDSAFIRGSEALEDWPLSKPEVISMVARPKSERMNRRRTIVPKLSPEGFGSYPSASKALTLQCRLYGLVRAVFTRLMEERALRLSVFCYLAVRKDSPFQARNDRFLTPDLGFLSQLPDGITKARM
jgi:hypothetical protein